MAASTGDITLMQSLWRVVSARGLCAHVHLLPPVGTEHADRRALAEQSRKVLLLYRQGAAVPATCPLQAALDRSVSD